SRGRVVCRMPCGVRYLVLVRVPQIATQAGEYESTVFRIQVHRSIGVRIPDRTMKPTLLTFAAVISAAAGFTAPSSGGVRMTTAISSTVEVAAPFAKGER
ncbi:hypothetical protein THAOC_26276, partial [Thalassiosira oceanica]